MTDIIKKKATVPMAASMALKLQLMAATMAIPLSIQAAPTTVGQSLNGRWNIQIQNTTEQTRSRSGNKQHASFSATIPNNLDDYYGYRQLKHGNLHGSAIYSRSFDIEKKNSRRYLLQFEGIGTYATVTLNDRTFPRELVGRTCYTLDVTEALRSGSNDISVLVDHPAYQTASPWVCGGCSSEWGFSEGSQPFGIFRPVSIIETPMVAIEPFGVHIWNNAACDSIFIDTEVKNHTDKAVDITLANTLADDGKRAVAAMSGTSVREQAIAAMTTSVHLEPGEMKTVRQTSAITSAHLWSLDDPYLYTLHTQAGDHVTDTEYGIRSISWPLHRKDGTGTFLLNGKNVFINGVCDYEHLFGQSHAFSNEEIESRMKTMRNAGFNAFREAHQPHNLYYQQLLDELGMLFWSQFSAHIWYDSPAFREAFKAKLRQWIRERRNSPSVILWGLQNESVLPTDFAEECSEIIRKLDPTCLDQRAITTCNGGTGTDWNVVQNWSGTYGGKIEEYDIDLKKPNQLLNGEYGAWRTLGLHGDHKYSEEKALNILMTKARKAVEVKDSVCGHFLWPLVSHENPGRRQPDESVRMIDKVGPFNYKGLITPWEQPTSLYQFYCEEYASDKGYEVPVPTPVKLYAKKMNYLYRVNCGGDEYRDSNGNVWAQDDTLYSHSWSETFKLNPFLASQGHITADIKGTDDDALFQTFRWGRHRLNYHFNLPNDTYRVEMYFTEPWLGENDTKHQDWSAMRLFDVDINGETVIDDLDIWKESGHAGAICKTAEVKVSNGQMTINFPEVKAGEAVISAIAIATKNKKAGIEIPKGTLPHDYWESLDRDTAAVYPKSLMVNDNDLPSIIYIPEENGRWKISPGVAKEYMLRFSYKNTSGQPIKARLRIIDSKQTLMHDGVLTLPPTPNKFKIISTVTSTQINAGTYQVILSDFEGAQFEKLEVQ